MPRAMALVLLPPALLSGASARVSAAPPRPDETRIAEPLTSQGTLHPILECVDENGAGGYIAYFGYRLEGTHALSIPAGTGNALSPGSTDRGQPTAFAPGRSPRHPDAILKVEFDGRLLTWTLTGPDGQARTATASASSRRCSSQPEAGSLRIVLIEPADGSRVATAVPLLRFGYSDDGTVDLGSLEVTVDEASRLDWFTVGPREAVGRPTEPLAPGTHRLRVSLADHSGRTTSAEALFTVDTDAPEVKVVEPTRGTFVSASSVEVRGSVRDASPVWVTVRGVDAWVESGEFRAVGVPVGDGPVVRLPVRATDAAGNVTESEAVLRVERRPPGVSISVPADGALVSGAVVEVRGTVVGAEGAAPGEDVPAVAVDVNGQPAAVDDGAFRVTVPVSATGAPMTLTATARSAAGLAATATAEISPDREAPGLEIDTPLPGTATRDRSLRVTGRVNDPRASVSVDGLVVPVTDGSFTTDVRLGGDGTQIIRVTALDPAGNQSEVEIPVDVDRTPPSLKLFGGPDGAPVDGRSLSIGGFADDDGAVSVTVNGMAADRLERAFQTQLAGLGPGRHLIQAVARDAAGNETRVTRSVNVVAPKGPVVLDPVAGPVEANAPVIMTPLETFAQSSTMSLGGGEGVVVGQVLSDATGLPLAGADVDLEPGSLGNATDASGRYSFVADEGPVRLRASMAGTTTVEREADVVAGVGAVAIDVRLTPRGAPVPIDTTGGSIAVEIPRRLQPADPEGPEPAPPAALSVTLPSGAVAGSHTLQLTPLTGQGLPGLLPLGYSPIVAFELAGTSEPALAEVGLTGLPELPHHLIEYDTDLHAWVLVASPLDPVGGALDFTLSGLGTWALVAVDPTTPPLVLPSPGGTLQPAPFAVVPEGTTSRILADPPSLPASGGTSHGRIEIDTPQPLPSGTVVQAVRSESFSLRTGASSSSEPRYEDVLLYRADLDGFLVPEEGAMALAAEIPIVASRQFEAQDLEAGRVHLRFLAGREDTRATGGSDAAVITADGATLSIPAGALGENTAVSLALWTAVTSVPAPPAGLLALAEVAVDLTGATLGLAAELRVPAGAVPAGGQIFVARLEPVGGETRLQVVARAVRVDDELVTQPWPPLPGILEGGRYVVYHVSQPVGLLAGTTLAGGTPTPAIVSTSGLPFVGLSGGDGAYAVLTLTGSVRAKARVLGTSLEGSADAMVAAGAVVPLDISVSQTLTTATVSPSTGATGVSVTRQIELEASVPLDRAFAIASNVQLRRASDGAIRSVHTVLSASGRHLAVIPDVPLEHVTSYTFEATGLVDSFGGPVAVPVVTFTTGSPASETQNLDALVFSYPVDGKVTMTAPAGALPSGTDILVLNVTSGSAVSYSVGSLPVEAELRASIRDRLWVSVTVPGGTVTTFERTEYVAPDGTTAVGVAGGKVRGSDGSEMRLPPGATDGAVTIKVSPVAELPAGAAPDLPGAQFGSGMLIDSADMPRFDKEVDLAFPKPAGAPEGAFYYVYRRVTLPEDRVAYETIDQAFLSEGKVVTASFPFPGYQTSFGSMGLLAGGAVVASAAQNLALLMWTNDELMPGKPTAGVITGRVLRAEVDPDTQELAYVPIPDAVVSGVNAAGYSLIEDPDSDGASVAVSQADGTFTMFDARYTGGLVMVAVRTPQGETKTATAYQANPMDSKDPGLRYFSNVARVNVAFDPLVPPPGPAVVDVTLVRTGPGGERYGADGLVVEGSSLLVGIRRRNAQVQSVTIGGQAYAFTDDTLPSSEPFSFDVVTSAAFVASPAGTYRVDVVALDEVGNPHTVSRSFRVVAAGGGNEETDPVAAPVVLDGQTYPADGALGVEVDALLRVEFSEPVRHVPGHVSLVEIDPSGAEAPVTVRVMGVPPGSQTAVDVTPPEQAEQPIVSLIVQPRPGLRYGTRYRLDLSGDILDLDPVGEGGPRALEPFSTTFTSLSLAAATSRDNFPSPAVAEQDGWAYLVQNEVARGILKVYDVRDPLQPTPVPAADRPVDNRPVDLGARPGRLVVGTSVPAQSVPSNVHVFDITRPDDPKWTGAASVSTGVLDGALVRLALHGRYVYALTHRKGVQVVDVTQAEANFAATGGPTEPAYWQMVAKLDTDGQGFGADAVVSTIPLPVSGQVDWYPHDLDIRDTVLGNAAQPVVYVVAEELEARTCPLLVGSPLASSFVAQVDLEAPGGQPLCPVRVVAGRVAGREVVVLGVALGTLHSSAIGWGLAVVDVSDPLVPVLIGFTALGLTDISDVVLDGDMALVASATAGTELVRLEDPTFPYVAGHIANLSGRLSVGQDRTYYSSGGTYAPGPEGGLHVANADLACELLSVRDERLLLEAIRDPEDATLCGGSDVLVFNVCQPSFVTVRIDGQVASLGLDQMPAQPLSELPLAPGTHVVTVPFGTIGTGLDTEKTFSVLARSQSDPTLVAERQGLVANKLVNRPVLPVGRTFVKGIDLFDGHVVRQATDLAVQGRHLGLQVTRTYSSAARGEDGVLGAGWGWNNQAAVSPSSCGLYHVSTADGGGQTFRTTDGGQTFMPQRGYHTALNRLADGGYEFVDKAGIRHFFREPVDPAQPDGARRLDRTVEPHGDRIEIAYDLLGRVSTVREVLRGERAVRSLQARYVRVYGHDRVASVTSSLGHRVEYGYDEKGNLISVKRVGTNVGGGPDAEPATESYEYDADDLRDPHQMTAAVGPNGDRTEYEYYQDSDVVPGEAAAFAWIITSKEELVKKVAEVAGVGPVPRPETAFAYDFNQAPGGIYKSTVTDARGNDTVYTLNIHGSPTHIQEPLGRETVIQWKPNDILKQDELDPLGRLTRYEYDANGNLTLETIEKDSIVLAETAYQYEHGFNKLIYKRDAALRVITYSIDSVTGDLLGATDPVGNVTVHHYDADGQLDWTRDPRGYTTQFRDFNDFGNARETENPLGQITTRVFDVRNRLVEEHQAPYGRETHVTYDGFDRPVERLRLSGQASGDERVLTEYYPGGQPRATTNPLGSRTEYTLDGLNRVVSTATVVDGETLTTERTYDGNGNVVSEIDRRGVEKLSTWDALNRLVQVRTAAGGPGGDPEKTVATFGYDLVGNKVWETDVAGRLTDYDYDELYRVETKWLPGSMPAGFTPVGRLHEIYTYDAVGNLTSSTDANGHTALREYDGLNRPRRVEDPVGRVTTIEYNDPEGSHVHKSREAETPRGLVTDLQYDPLGREILRTVTLAGEDGDPAPNPGPYVTQTQYVDDEHAVLATDARGTVTRVDLDGLDREITRTVDPGALDLRTTTEYDGAGNRTRVVDPRGHPTSWQYDTLGRLLVETDAQDQERTFTYDGEGLKLTETDRRGVTTEHAYDNLGRLRMSELQSSPFSGVAWSREIAYVDAIPTLRRETDARGHTTEVEFDGLGRVVRETDPLSQSVLTTWDGVNKRVVRDKRGNETRFDYDAANRVTKVADPAPFDAQTVETSYDDASNRVTEKDRRGTYKVTQTDPLGRVVRVTGASGTVEETVLERSTYDPLGNTVLAIDGAGKKLQFTYDAANRLASRIDGFETADAATTAYRYDANGNQTKVIDPRSTEAEPSEERAYDELNRVTDEWNGEGNHTAYAYDAEGNRTSVQAPLGGLTAFLYDELGTLTRVTQPEPGPGEGNPVTAYVYDPNRNRIEQTDANGHVVTMAYDELNRLTTMRQDPTGLDLTTAHQYDENGNETVLTDPKGQTVTSTYDELDRVTSKTYAFAANDPGRPWRHTTSIDYGYDANGNLLTAAEYVASGTDPPDPTPLAQSRAYDLLDRLTSETQALPDGGAGTVAYTYLGNGSRETVTDPAASVTRYTYDGKNRLQTATTAWGAPEVATTTYTYLPDDLLETVTYPNAVVATHAYDDADRLTSLTNTRGPSTVSSYTYTYDANGNRLSQVEANGVPTTTTETTTYTYDGLDRLETVTYPVDATYPLGRVVEYGYDAVGNRIRETGTDSAATVLADLQGIFDNVNRLTTLNNLVTPADSTIFTWDPNGNQVTKTQGSVITSNTYDVRDKLVEVQQDSSIVGRFQYDFEGRRTKKIGDEGIRQYVYDQTSLLVEYDDGGVQKAKYDYGSDRLIALTRTDEGRRYFSLDGLRSVVNLTDDTGSAVASYHLDAWGNFRFPSELDDSKNRFAFTGHIYDPETGLYNAKARYFDPKLGRFLTQDSYLGQIDDPPSLHRYFYARNNPTTRFDLTGFSDADANALAAEMFKRTGALNDAANQVAVPISQRLEGVTNLILPVSYLRDSRAEGASYTRSVQYGLIDAASDSSNSAGVRLAAGVGAAALQPGAALNDIAHGLVGVPGQLGEAGSHVKRAFQAESTVAAAYELAEAVEKTAGAAEMVIGAILLTRGGAKIVEEGRTGRAEAVPVEGKTQPRARVDYANHGSEFDGLDRMVDQPPPAQSNAGPRRPYSHLEDHPSVAPEKPFTATQKRNVLAENESRNSGVLLDDETGEALVRPRQHRRGETPPDNEAHVDHVDPPRSLGGSNSYANAAVRSRKANLAKSNKPWKPDE